MSFTNLIMVECFMKELGEKYLGDLLLRYRVGVADIKCHKPDLDGLCPLCYHRTS